jgi:hypothetical protein
MGTGSAIGSRENTFNENTFKVRNLGPEVEALTLDFGALSSASGRGLCLRIRVTDLESPVALLEHLRGAGTAMRLERLGSMRGPDRKSNEGGMRREIVSRLLERYFEALKQDSDVEALLQRLRTEVDEALERSKKEHQPPVSAQVQHVADR